MADAQRGSKPVDQDTLVADIDHTRAELARTIDAISDRVSPRRNVERAADELRERASQIDPVTVGAVVAAVVIGVGVTVLLLVRRRRKR
jgi:multisubunit Na+/H+ antiporter MnhC subunit